MKLLALCALLLAGCSGASSRPDPCPGGEQEYCEGDVRVKCRYGEPSMMGALPERKDCAPGFCSEGECLEPCDPKSYTPSACDYNRTQLICESGKGRPFVTKIDCAVPPPPD